MAQQDKWFTYGFLDFINVNNNFSKVALDFYKITASYELFNKLSASIMFKETYAYDSKMFLGITYNLPYIYILDNVNIGLYYFSGENYNNTNIKNPYFASFTWNKSLYKYNDLLFSYNGWSDIDFYTKHDDQSLQIQIQNSIAITKKSTTLELAYKYWQTSGSSHHNILSLILTKHL